MSSEREAQLEAKLAEALAAYEAGEPYDPGLSGSLGPIPPELLERFERARASIHVRGRPRRPAAEPNELTIPEPSLPDTSFPDASFPDTSLPDVSLPEPSLSDTSLPGSPPPVAGETEEGPRGPRRIGRFEIQGTLGHGGSGVVFLAFDPALRRKVALKVPRLEALVSDDARRRFLLEARAAALLDHPHVVPVYEVAEAGPVCYIASAYCEGGSLAGWLKAREGPVPAALAARLSAEVAEGVAHAHGRGVLHRDLKPSNIMLQPAREGEAPGGDGLGLVPRVGDFGLAKLVGEESGVSLPGSPVGTPSYMAPEQARGGGWIGPATDVYGIGAILYELLTGRPPFRGDSMADTIVRLETEEPAAPRRLRGDVPRALESICLTCLQKDPAARYSGPGALADDLRRFLAGEPVRARRPSMARRLLGGRRLRRRLGAAAGIAAVSVLLALGLARAMEGRRPAAPVVSASEAPRAVVLPTRPPGALAVFVPLSPVDGQFQPDRAIRSEPRRAGAGAGAAEVRVNLPPGEYFVEVGIPGHGFHQVFRTVPRPGEITRIYRQCRSKVSRDGTVELPAITIPPRSVTEGMARLPGHPRFLMGTDPLRQLTRHFREVAPFFLDTHEVSVGSYRKIMQRLPRSTPDGSHPRDSDPVTWVNYEEALEYAEVVGKRLPDEAEHEFADTMGGENVYPWGNSAEPLAERPWQFGAVGEPAFDRTPTDPPICNLYSNVVEWTISSPAPYPHPRAIVLPWVPMARVIRGGPFVVATGKTDADDNYYGPRWRAATLRDQSHPKLGFRCARSERPRYLRLDASPER